MAVQASPAQASPAASASPDSGRTGANAQVVSPDPSSASSPSDNAQAQRGPDYFREAFSRIRGQTQDARPREQSQAPQAPPARQAQRPDQKRNGAVRRQTGTSGALQAPPSTTLPEAGANPQQAPETLTLTREQLARYVQSESDRLLARRHNEEQARRAREEELHLRAQDPLEYVRRVEERETQERIQAQRSGETMQVLDQQLFHYDRAILDPIIGALPEKTRTTLLKSVKPDGIQGRSELLKQGLKALQQYWQTQGKVNARTSLMKDEAFVKEVLARYGGVRTEIEPTPALPPSAAGRAPTTNDAVNTWMRNAGNQVRATSGRR